MRVRARVCFFCIKFFIALSRKFIIIITMVTHFTFARRCPVMPSHKKKEKKYPMKTVRVKRIDKKTYIYI